VVNEVTVMSAPGLDSRRAAYTVLQQVRAGRPFEAALDRAVQRLTEPDRRLAHELAAGVLRSQTALDERLAPLVPRGWASVAPELKEVLRLGAFQLTALDRVPAHSAVDTSVALAKEAGGARAGGFVNAVLRRVGRLEGVKGVVGPAGTAAVVHAPAGEPTAAQLADAASHPHWLVERWLARFGPAETEALLHWNNTRPRLVLQPAREPAEELERRWRAAGIEVSPAAFGAGLITDRSRPQDLPGYAQGAFQVQDPAQALLAWYADLAPDATLYDACAAPGGKAITLGRGMARVVAGDASRARIRRLAGNLRRAGSGREFAIVADALAPPVRPVDAVLVDAPCLGTGTFARHPDARWRVTPEALTSLAEHQAALLDHASAAVASGGLLLYSTCSIEPEENAEQVERFLAHHPEYRREPSETFPATLTSPEGDLMILPHRHQMDGAFAARLRRTP
jgi:16S rRNA (cytosine967-C5)-methyltransferase